MNSTEDEESVQSSTTPLTANTANHSGPLSFYEIQHLTVQLELMKSGCLPVVIFGIVGNLASLWIWQAQATFTPTTFLLKYLAIADTGFLVGDLILLRQVTHFREVSWAIFLGHFGRIFQVMSVNATLAVAVFRFLAVYRPIRAPLMLSRGRVVTLCVAIFVWGLLAEIVRLAAILCFVLYPPRTAAVASPFCRSATTAFDIMYKHHRNEVVAYLTPLVLMLVFNVAILWKVHHRDVINIMTQRQRAPVQRASRRLTLCVVIITSTCFVSYPLTFVVRWAVLGNASAQVVGTFAFVAVLLILVNSSINVVYYWSFTSEFRRLTAVRFRTLLCTRSSDRPRAGSHVTVSADLSSAQVTDVDPKAN